MVVYRNWEVRKARGLETYRCDGWFLCGFIPLYVRRIQIK